jgi:hypothetical protein
MVADLGRHLQNGRVLVSALEQSDHALTGAILHTNFYSATQANFPFINHHWGSGVILYGVFLFGGFSLLSVFFIVLSLLTFLLFFTVARKGSNFYIAALCSVWLIPLLADRTEIRPELFSYFFCAVFFYLLWSYTKGLLKNNKILFLLPLLQLVWANLHIYFFLGFAIIGAFWVEALATQPQDKKRVQLLSAIGALCLGAGALTPFGLAGLLYPLGIFKNYGYSVLENQSVFTIIKQGLVYSNIVIFCITAVIILLGFAVLVLRRPRTFLTAEVLLAIMVVLAGVTAVRNLALLGFFGVALLPLLTVRLKEVFFPRLRLSGRWVWGLGCAVMLLTAFVNRTRLVVHSGNFGVGLPAGALSAADFMQSNAVRGPLFNNFDSGGYLIWSLYPKTKVFVDNRPEAYPAAFFTDTYIPMQLDESMWKKELEVNKFNTIFFSLSESTPWGQRFLVDRVQDPEWAPVFLDTSALIFLRRTPENTAVIKQYEISKDHFGVATE